MMSQLSGHWNAEAGKAEKVPSNCITALYLEGGKNHEVFPKALQAGLHPLKGYSVELGWDLVVKQAFSMCMALVSSTPTNNQVLFTECPVTPGQEGRILGPSQKPGEGASYQ